LVLDTPEAEGYRFYHSPSELPDFYGLIIYILNRYHL